MSRNKSDRETWGELHFAQLTYRKEHDIAAWSFLHDYLGFENPTPYQMSLLYKAGMFSNPSTTENSPGKEMRNALSAFFLSQVVPKYIRPTTLHVHAMLQEWCHENCKLLASQNVIKIEFSDDCSRFTVHLFQHCSQFDVTKFSSIVRGTATPASHVLACFLERASPTKCKAVGPQCADLKEQWNKDFLFMNYKRQQEMLLFHNLSSEQMHRNPLMMPVAEPPHRIFRKGSSSRRNNVRTRDLDDISRYETGRLARCRHLSGLENESYDARCDTDISFREPWWQLN